MNYSKKPLSVDEQIDRLEQREQNFSDSKLENLPVWKNKRVSF